MPENQKYNRVADFNVLLIEDNPGDAKLVELLLRESDFLNIEITHKTTLKDAIRAIEKNIYAAILVDLNLPDSKGLKTLNELFSRFQDLNVIVLTGLSDKKLAVRCVKAGAQDFLIKGAFDADGLAKSLRYSIERYSILTRLEEIQKVAEIGNWELNIKTKEFRASDTVFSIFDCPIRNLVDYDSVFHEDSPWHNFSRLFDEVIIGNQGKSEFEIKDSNGNQKSIYVQYSTNDESDIVVSGIIQDVTFRRRKEKIIVGILDLKKLVGLQTAFIQYWNFFTDYVKGVKGEEIMFNIKKHPKGLEWEIELNTEISLERIQDYLDEYLNYLLDRSIVIEDKITRSVIPKKEIELLKLKHQLQINHLEQQILIYEKENSILASDKKYLQEVVLKMLSPKKSIISEKEKNQLDILKSYVAKNNFKVLFDQLSNLTKENEFYNEVIIHKSNYSLLQQELRKNVINKGDYTIKVSQLRNSLLALIDDIFN